MWVGAPAPAPSRRIYANPSGVAQAWNEFIAASPGHEAHLEHLAVFTVGENNTISGFRMLAKGSGNSVGVMATELVLTAACAGAISIFVAHNHPDNSVEPSEGDIAWTRKAAAVCEIAGVRLVDHVIVPSRPTSSEPLFASLRDLGHFAKFDADITSQIPTPKADRFECLLLSDPDLAVAMNKAAKEAGVELWDFAGQTVLELLRSKFLSPS